MNILANMAVLSQMKDPVFAVYQRFLTEDMANLQGKNWQKFVLPLCMRFDCSTLYWTELNLVFVEKIF